MRPPSEYITSISGASCERVEKLCLELRLESKLVEASVNRDHAIIERIHDEDTEQFEVIVAGIGMSGTMAVGEF